MLSLLYFSCSKEDVKPNKKEGTVEFGFSLKAPSHGGAQKSSMMAAAEPAAVVVSIKKANGSLAYTMEKVELYNMNGYYISKPLSLLPGNYTVEQFFVVDAAGNVVYASPVQGSPKAYLVSKPLPISFSVGKDIVTKIVPEVLSAEGSTPEDFGYSTFSFEVVKPFDFLIGVFAYNESIQNFEMTTANLSIAASNKTVFADTLAAITNKVTVNDGYDDYILTVTKEGYKAWVDTLTAAELKLHFRSEDKGPLVVVLEKGAAFTEIKYGRLYNWYAATDTRSIANAGWKVASLLDFERMDSVVRPFSGGAIKDTNSFYWNAPNTGATNEAKFNMRGAGVRYQEVFIKIKEATCCWTSDTFPYRHIVKFDMAETTIGYGLKSSGSSVRLIKEFTTLSHGQTGTYTGNDGKVYRTICIGTQEWIADNLAETKYRNGDIIPEVTDNNAWVALTTGAWCAYDNDHSNI